MNITWYGHAAFLVETETGHGPVRVIMDPFSSRTGYAPISEPADVVTLSHDNPKYHSCLDELQGDPEIVHGLELGDRVVEAHGVSFGAVPVFESYDFATNTGEGPNTMVWLESEGLRVLHMGDVGHRLTDAVTSACGAVDVLLAPTGGMPTIQLADLRDFIDRLRPRLVVPMHYGTAKVDMKILPVQTFTALFDSAQVRVETSPTIEVSRATLPPRGAAPVVRVLPHTR